MKRRLEREGSIYSKLGQLIRETGYSKPVNIELATVIEAPPNLRIRLDQDELVLEKEDLIISEHLTRHDRVVSINYKYPQTWDKDDDIGDMEKQTKSSRNNIGSGEAIPYENYSMENAKLTFEDVLKIDDRVIVVCLEEDMVFVILDRARWYV